MSEGDDEEEDNEDGYDNGGIYQNVGAEKYPKCATRILMGFFSVRQGLRGWSGKRKKVAVPATTLVIPGHNGRIIARAGSAAAAAHRIATDNK